MSITLATSPQSNMQLFKRGLKLYFASFKQVFGLALLFSVIVTIPQWLALLHQSNVLDLIRSFQFYNLFFILMDICAVFVFTAMLWRIRCVVTHQHESILDDFKIAARKIILILGVSVVFMVILGLVVFFFITLPAQNFMNRLDMTAMNIALLLFMIYFAFFIYVYYLLFFSLPLILTEDRGLFAALRKSIYLVWGNWWRVFLLLATPVVFYYFFISLILGLFHFNLDISYAQPFEYQSLLKIALQILFVALFVPFQGGLLLLQLRDLELRKQV